MSFRATDTPPDKGVLILQNKSTFVFGILTKKNSHLSYIGI